MESYVPSIVVMSESAGIVLSVLLLLSNFVGLVFLVLSGTWLFRSATLTAFKKIAVAFMWAGLLAPVAYSVAWSWSVPYGARIRDASLMFWPTAIEMMAMDQPGPPSLKDTVSWVTLSALGNVAIYGVVGFVVAWLYGRFTRRRDA